MRGPETRSPWLKVTRHMSRVERGCLTGARVGRSGLSPCQHFTIFGALDLTLTNTPVRQTVKHLHRGVQSLLQMTVYPFEPMDHPQTPCHTESNVFTKGDLRGTWMEHCLTHCQGRQQAWPTHTFVYPWSTLVSMSAAEYREWSS